MDSSDLARDLSGTRAYSQFIMELAEKCPAAVLPNISLLLGHLDGEVCHRVLKNFLLLFMPPPFEEWWRGIKCYPCRACVRSFVRPSVFKIWCPLNYFCKTASIQFKFGMLIYNIKTQVKFDLGKIH